METLEYQIEYHRSATLNTLFYIHIHVWYSIKSSTILVLVDCNLYERWGAGVETQKNVRGEVGGWGRVPFNKSYAPSLSTIYDGA